jgi:zinc protease
MLGIFIGGFNESLIRESIENYFGTVPPRAVAEPQTFSLPEIKNQQIYYYTGNFSKKTVSLGFACPNAFHPGFPALQILSDLFAYDQFQTKVFIEQKGHKIYSINADVEILKGLSALRFEFSFPKEQDEQAVIDAFLSHIEDIAKKGIDKEIVARAKIRILSQEAALKEKIHYYTMMKAPLIIAASPRSLLAYNTAIENVTSGDVHKALTTWVNAVPFTGLITIPGKTEKKVLSAPTAALEPIERTQFANGLEAILEKWDGSQMFAVHVLASGRVLREPEGKGGIPELLHRLLIKGTRKWNKTEIQEQLGRIGATLEVAPGYTSPFGDFYASSRYSYIRMEVLAQYAEDAMNILSEIMSSPLFDKSAIEDVTREVMDIAEAKRKEPGFLGGELLREKIFLNAPAGRSIFGSPEQLTAITRQDLIQFRQDYFSPSNLIISVVSGLPHEQVTSLLQKTFALQQGPKVNTWLPAKIEPPAKPETIETDLGSAQSMVLMGTLLPSIGIQEKFALDIAVSIFNAQLFRNLREKEGLAYSLGASITYYGDAGYFVISVKTSKEKVQRVKEALLEELKVFTETEIGTEEITRRVNAITGRYQMRMLSSINRAYYLGIAEMQGLDHSFGEEYKKRLEQITVTDVKRVITQIISPAQYITVVVQ